MARDEEFKAIIARAREAQQAALVDEMIDMADQATPDDWQVVRLRIWARQWTAGKLAPRTYGERVAHTGADGGALEMIVTGVRRITEDGQNPNSHD